MATVYERNGGWYIDFREAGKRYRERVPGADVVTKKLAGDYLAKRKREVAEGIINPKPEAVAPITFAAFAESYIKKACAGKKSVDRDAGILEMYTAHWSGRDLADIGQEEIEAFKAKRLETRAPATVLRELVVLKRTFKKAVQWGRLTVNPAAGVEMPKVQNNRVRYLDSAEMHRLVAALPGWLRDIAVFARFTGARRGEILGLKWTDCDTKRGLMVFRDTKTGTDQTVKMNQTVRALLESLPAPIDRTQPVFPGYQNAANKGTWLVNMNHAWKAACKTAGLTDFHFHDLRHQAATDLLTEGAVLNDVRDFLRHKGSAMTLRYAHLTDDRREATARLLDRVASRETLGTQAGTGN